MIVRGARDRDRGREGVSGGGRQGRTRQKVCSFYKLSHGQLRCPRPPPRPRLLRPGTGQCGTRSKVVIRTTFPMIEPDKLSHARTWSKRSRQGTFSDGEQGRSCQTPGPCCGCGRAV